jgi:hypothetical protein
LHCKHTNKCWLAEEELDAEEEEYDLIVDNLEPEIQQPISMEGPGRMPQGLLKKLHLNKFVTSIIKH